MKRLTVYLHVTERGRADWNHGDTLTLLGARSSMPRKGKGEAVVKLRLLVPDSLFAEPPVQVIEVAVPEPEQPEAASAVAEAEAVDP